PESGECEIPRILEVEMLEGRDNNSGLIYPKILDSSNVSLSIDLINYAVANKITQLALFKLGYIFDSLGIQHQYLRDDKEMFKGLLDNFLQTCAANKIVCGYVSDNIFYTIDSTAEYNIQKFTYNHTGKFHFVKLEHEYWNAIDPDANIVPLDGSPSAPKPLIGNKSFNDAYYQEVHQDHLTLLSRLRNKKYNNANLWEVYDYIGKLYCELPPPSTGTVLGDTVYLTYNFHNQTAVKSKAQDLDGKSDAIMLVHYQSYHVNDGVDFLDTNSTNFSVTQWRKRLSYFGNNSSKKTVVIPLFSAEDSTECGQSIETKFLGHVLEGAPYYGSKHLNNVEGAYNLQHKGIYNSSNSTYSQVQNIKLKAYAWFKYDCIKTKSFSVVTRHLCDTLGFAYDPLVTKEPPSISDALMIYPNPNKGSFQVLSKNQKIKNVRVFDSVGRIVTTISVDNSTTSVVELNTTKGLYFVATELETGETKVSKIVIQ
ncbi:MAG: T9SS type A sorting domain-containing protein, partial [Flavobacteriales bacterium]|nr:T9SS type A sorting domain-containing protein [Flavobacteriales bacterium]